MARPQTLTPEQIDDIRQEFAEYIETNDDPTIVGFVSSHPKIELNDGKEFYLNKDYMSDHDEFSELRKRAIEKQEDYLLKNATINKANPTIAIFRLKQPQHGYKDKFEQELTLKEVDLSDRQTEQLLKARRNRADS